MGKRGRMLDTLEKGASSDMQEVGENRVEVFKRRKKKGHNKEIPQTLEEVPLRTKSKDKGLFLSGKKNKPPLPTTNSDSSSSDRSRDRNRRVQTRSKKCRGTTKKEDEPSGDCSRDVTTKGHKRPKKSRATTKKEGKPGRSGNIFEILDASTSEESSCEGEPDFRFDNVVIRNKFTYYRSNLTKTAEDLQVVPYKKVHKDLIKGTPFWLLFDTLMKTDKSTYRDVWVKDEDTIRSVLYCYDFLGKNFVIAGERFEISSWDVHLILGVSGGDIPVKLGNDKSILPEWVKRCFGKDIKTGRGGQVFTRKIVHKTLVDVVTKNEAGMESDVARLTHLYLLAAFLAPGKSGAIPWQYTCGLEDFSEIWKYNWCKMIADLLKEQIHSSKDTSIGGCAMLLPFWLCEHFFLIPKSGEHKLPRILKWDLAALNKRIAGANLRQLHPKYIKKQELKPTKKEKQQLQNMLLLWNNLTSEKKDKPIHENSVDAPSENYLHDENSDSQGIDEVYQTVRLGHSTPNDESTHIQSGSELQDDCGTKVGTGGATPGLDVDNTSEGKEVVQCDGQVSILDNSKKDTAAFEVTADALKSPKQLTKMAGNPGDGNTEVDAITNRNGSSDGIHTEGKNQDCAEHSQRLEENLREIHPAVEYPIHADEADEKIAGKTDVLVFEDMTMSPDPSDVSETQDGKKLDAADKEEAGNIDEQFVTPAKSKSEVDTNQIKTPSFSLNLTQQMEPIEKIAREVEELLDSVKATTNCRNSWPLVDAQTNNVVGEKMGLKEKQNHDGSLLDDREKSMVSRMKKAAEDNLRIASSKTESLKEKDAEIQTLNQQLRHLEKTVQKVLNPTATQVMESTQNQKLVDTVTELIITRGERDELLVRADELEDSLNLNHTIDYHPNLPPVEVTPVVKKKRTKRRGTVGSIARDVKHRTLAGERKSVDISPQLDTTELVKKHEGKRRPASTILDDEYLAARESSDDVRLSIENGWKIGKDDFVLWRGEKGVSAVFVKDVINILHHDEISDCVMDGWGELVVKMYNGKSTIGTDVKVFSSSCLNLLKKSKGKPNRNLTQLLDKRLETMGSSDILLFPILAAGRTRGSNVGAAHWTLLKMDLSICRWLFFNSMPPRVDTIKDPHLEKTVDLVQYVVNKLRELFEKNNPGHMLLSIVDAKPTTVRCMEQESDSLDCGVVVCQLIENEVLKVCDARKLFTHEDAGYYRKKIVEMFVVAGGTSNTS